MNDNPYQPPVAEESGLCGDSKSGTPAHLGVRIFAWVMWVGLVISLVWNLVDKNLYLVSKLGFSGRPGFLVLTLVAAAQAVMVLVMRWIFFRFMMRNVDPAGLRGAVRCIVGVVVVYGMIKAMEIVGLRLWFGSGWLAHYYLFALPGFVLAGLLQPGNLENYVVAGQKDRAGRDRR